MRRLGVLALAVMLAGCVVTPGAKEPVREQPVRENALPYVPAPLPVNPTPRPVLSPGRPLAPDLAVALPSGAPVAGGSRGTDRAFKSFGWPVAGKGGAVYFNDPALRGVWHLTADGSLALAAGHALHYEYPPVPEAPDPDAQLAGVPATGARLGFISHLALDADERLLLADVSSLPHRSAHGESPQTWRLLRLEGDGKLTVVAATATLPAGHAVAGVFKGAKDEARVLFSNGELWGYTTGKPAVLEGRFPNLHKYQIAFERFALEGGGLLGVNGTGHAGAKLVRIKPGAVEPEQVEGPPSIVLTTDGAVFRLDQGALLLRAPGSKEERVVADRLEPLRFTAGIALAANGDVLLESDETLYRIRDKKALAVAGQGFLTISRKQL